MTTTTWENILKNNDKITITFDANSYQDIRKALNVTSKNCCFCSKRITSKNIGAFLGKNRICCKNAICLIDYIQETKKVK